jgi:hypothetical protein
VIEGGLDKGWIVIVPDKSPEEEEITWRCVLVEQSRGSSMICPGIKWRVSIHFSDTVDECG